MYRRLGSTDLEPSALGFGCSTIASLGTRHPRQEVESTLREALDAGINFFDTADVYGQGDSERLLGKIIRGKREGIIVCTKAGLTVGPMERVVRLAKPFVNALMIRWRAARTATADIRRRSERQCFDPEYLRRRIEGSLRRLNVERIDLFLLHNPPTDMEERSGVFDMLNRFKQEGKLRHSGISCRSLADAEVWIEQPGVACVQVPISAMRLPEATPVLARAEARGVGVIAREVFSDGGQSRGLVSDSLSPLLRHAAIGTVLVGMTCRQHLRENLRAVNSITAASRL